MSNTPHGDTPFECIGYIVLNQYNDEDFQWMVEVGIPKGCKNSLNASESINYNREMATFWSDTITIINITQIHGDESSSLNQYPTYVVGATISDIRSFGGFYFYLTKERILMSRILNPANQPPFKKTITTYDYSDDGILEEETYYENGIIQYTNSYYSCGTLKEHIIYSNECPHKKITYHPNGQVHTKIHTTTTTNMSIYVLYIEERDINGNLLLGGFGEFDDVSTPGIAHVTNHVKNASKKI